MVFIDIVLKVFVVKLAIPGNPTNDKYHAPFWGIMILVISGDGQAPYI